MITRKSTEGGWTRGIDKYSPSKEITLSPVKCSQANLKSTLLEDDYLKMFSWTLNMSEQHYYDNVFIVLSYGKNDERKTSELLHRSFIEVGSSFFTSLTDIVILGQGAFGSVYSCRDPKTNIKYAIKQLSESGHHFRGHTRHILDYLLERNANIRAMDSPSVVRFYYSHQNNTTGDLLLFFEFCVGDLSTFIEDIKEKDPGKISKMLFENDQKVIRHIHDGFKEDLEVCLIYVFEIFCALDFLVKCNIIHQDIKPDNIMVSSTLHLKIGDFGLAYKTRAINRKTNALLVDPSKINQLESTNYNITRCGTRHYEDLELHLMWLKGHSKVSYDQILQDNSTFNIAGLSMEPRVLEPTFLVDTWAAGITAVMLLFRGFRIFNPDYTASAILTDVPRECASLFLVHLVARRSIYTNYVNNGLVLSGGKRHRALMAFIASIFKPRLTRCAGYTKEKLVYHFNESVTMQYVDIDRIEEISSFSKRNFCRSTIHLRYIPENIHELYPEKVPDKETNFDDVFNDTKEFCQVRTMNFNPGVTINIFN